MDELTAVLPHLTAGAIAVAVAFLRAILSTPEAGRAQRLTDALICGLCAVAVSTVTKNHISLYATGDSIAIAFCVGFLGAGKVSDFAVRLAKKRMGLGDDEK